MLPNLTFHLLILFIQAVNIYWVPTDRPPTGAHGWNGSLYWPQKQRIKSQWPLRLTKLPEEHSVFPLHLPFQGYETTGFQTSGYTTAGLGYRLKINHHFREFFTAGVWKRPCQKGRTQVILKGQSSSRFPSNKFPFLAWLPGLLSLSALTSHLLL